MMRIYKTTSVVEQEFHVLMSELGIAPVFHRRPALITVHFALISQQGPHFLDVRASRLLAAWFALIFFQKFGLRVFLELFSQFEKFLKLDCGISGVCFTRFEDCILGDDRVESKDHVITNARTRVDDRGAKDAVLADNRSLQDESLLVRLFAEIVRIDMTAEAQHSVIADSDVIRVDFRVIKDGFQGHIVSPDALVNEHARVEE